MIRFRNFIVLILALVLLQGLFSQQQYLDVEDIKKVVFFSSGRIDIELYNNKKIRFPINSKIDDFNLGLRLIESEKLNKSKILDLRIPNKVITYDQ